LVSVILSQTTLSSKKQLEDIKKEFSGPERFDFKAIGVYAPSEVYFASEILEWRI